MPKVRFLSRQVMRTGRPEGDTVYEAGEVYDLRPDQVRRWLNRNAVERVVAGEPERDMKVPPPEERPRPAEARAARGTNLDDPGTGAPPPDAMTTADVQPAPTGPGGDEFETMLREDLLDLAAKRGIEFPSGYVSKADAITALRRHRASR